MGETRSLALAAIHAEADIQPRYSMSASFIEEYAEQMRAGATFPPVVVFVDADGIHWLADGFHRFNAHKVLGVPEIEADVRVGSRDAAILYSVGANATHGLRRTNLDKRRAVERCIALWTAQGKTFLQREVAAQCGVHQTLVSLVLHPKAHEIHTLPSFPVSGADAMLDTALANGSANHEPQAPVPPFRPSTEFAFERQPISDFVPPEDWPELEVESAESKAYGQVIALTHVTRFEVDAVVAAVDPERAVITAPLLRTFAEWLLGVAVGLEAKPRLALVEQGRTDHDR